MTFSFDHNLFIIIIFQMESDKPDNGQYIQYKYRWVIVGLYALSTIVGSIISGSVAPIATKLSETYDMSPVTINMNSMIYLLAYAIMNFPANYFIDGRGIKIGMIIGNIMFAVGVSIQLFVNVSFYFVILGGIFNSFGNPFIMNTPAKIATFWFKNENRTVATSILTAMNIVGSGIGFVLPTLIIDQNATIEECKAQVFGMYILQAILIGITLTMNFLFLKSQPPTPASLGSETQKTPFKQSIKQLISNIQFIKLFVGFIFFYGCLNTFASVSNFVFRPYGYSDVAIGMFGVGLIFAGVTGSIFTSLYVRKTLLYKRALVFLCMAGLGFMIIQTGILTLMDSTVLTFMGICLVGFTATPILPITYDLGCQIAFPVGQAQITGILNSAGMIFSFFMILGSEFAIGFGSSDESFAMLVFLIVIMGMGLIFYVILKPKLKRRQAQAGIKQSLEASNSMPQQSPDVQIQQIELSNLQSLQKPNVEYVDFTEQK